MLYNFCMKRVLATILLIMFLGTNTAVFADVLQGHAEKTEQYEQQVKQEKIL